MTTVEEVGKQLNDLATHTYNAINKYQADEDKALKELDDGYRGQAEVQETFREKRYKEESTIRDKAGAIRDNLEKMKESELQKLSDKEVPVTSDMVAELDMLEKTVVEGEDISKYIKKYKNTPLAYRRLETIAKQNKIMADFPPTKAEYLDTIIDSVAGNLNYLSYPNFNRGSGGGFGGVTLGMKYEGVLDETNRHIDRYKEL